MLGGAARADLERDWKKDQLSVDDKIQRLLEALHGGLYVILLDHIEDLLDGEGQITDAEVRKLVDRSLAARDGSAAAGDVARSVSPCRATPRSSIVR